MERVRLRKMERSTIAEIYTSSVRVLRSVVGKMEEPKYSEGEQVPKSNHPSCWIFDAAPNGVTLLKTGSNLDCCGENFHISG